MYSYRHAQRYLSDYRSLRLSYKNEAAGSKWKLEKSPSVSDWMTAEQ